MSVRLKMRVFALLCSVLAWSTVPVASARADGTVDVELNALKPADGACQMAFVVRNGLDAGIASLGMELVVFDGAGVMERVVRINASDVPAGSMRFKMFAIPGLDCAKVGSVLLNEITSCEGGASLATKVCAEAVRATHKTAIKFIR